MPVRSAAIDDASDTRAGPSGCFGGVGKGGVIFASALAGKASASGTTALANADPRPGKAGSGRMAVPVAKPGSSWVSGWDGDPESAGSRGTISEAKGTPDRSSNETSCAGWSGVSGAASPSGSTVSASKGSALTARLATDAVPPSAVSRKASMNPWPLLEIGVQANATFGGTAPYLERIVGVMAAPFCVATTMQCGSYRFFTARMA